MKRKKRARPLGVRRNRRLPIQPTNITADEFRIEQAKTERADAELRAVNANADAEHNTARKACIDTAVSIRQMYGRAEWKTLLLRAFKKRGKQYETQCNWDECWRDECRNISVKEWLWIDAMGIEIPQRPIRIDPLNSELARTDESGKNVRPSNDPQEQLLTVALAADCAEQWLLTDDDFNLSDADGVARKTWVFGSQNAQSDWIDEFRSLQPGPVFDSIKATIDAVKTRIESGGDLLPQPVPDRTRTEMMALLDMSDETLAGHLDKAEIERPQKRGNNNWKLTADDQYKLLHAIIQNDSAWKKHRQKASEALVEHRNS